MQATDITGIKSQNVLHLLHALRFEEQITKKQLADRTGLSFATVSNLCNELAENGMILTEKNADLTVGRKPQTLMMNYNCYCVICINIQKRSVLELSVMNYRNETLASRSYHTAEKIAPEKLIALAKQYYLNDLRPLLKKETKIIGVGVAVSSIFDICTGKLINCAIGEFENCRMKAIVENEFNYPAYVDNESNLCAYALTAQVRDCKNMVYIHISEGVGLGIVSGGTLLRGGNGYAGEIAHMPVGRPEVQCKGCGCFGCIESDLAIPGFLGRYYGNESGDWSDRWECYLQDLYNGKPEAVQLAKENGVLLGRLVSVITNLLDPDVVYIGGDIAAAYSFMEHQVLDQIHSHRMIWCEDIPQVFCDRDSQKQINLGLSEYICSAWLPG